MFSSLWARITGSDKKKTYPEQQGAALGRAGDFVVLFPYGLYADLPNDTLLRMLGEGAAMGVTVVRPADLAPGEPTLFHPVTNTRIVVRNNGDVDVYTDDAGGNVNVTTVNATITASSSVTVDTPQSTFMGNVQINGALNVNGNITGLANIIATALLQGATLTVTGAGSINGRDFISHTHPQGNDSGGNVEQNTGGVI